METTNCTIVTIIRVTSWIQNRLQSQNTNTNPTLQYSDTTEQRLSIHSGLFTEESYTPSISHVLYVLWSQVGRLGKRSHVSLKHSPPPSTFVWKQLIKIKSCVWYLFRRSPVVHFWVAALKIFQRGKKKNMEKLHCTKWDSHNLFARKKSNKEWLVPAVFWDTPRQIH